MASFKRQKVFAISILVLYAFIILTFSLAHRDFVPLRGNLTITPVNSLYHALDANENDLGCPAHNFAQSTTNTPALSQHFSSPENFFFLKIDQHDYIFSASVYNLSTRAPPQA